MRAIGNVRSFTRTCDGRVSKRSSVRVGRASLRESNQLVDRCSSAIFCARSSARCNRSNGRRAFDTCSSKGRAATVRPCSIRFVPDQAGGSVTVGGGFDPIEGSVRSASRIAAPETPSMPVQRLDIRAWHRYFGSTCLRDCSGSVLRSRELGVQATRLGQAPTHDRRAAEALHATCWRPDRQGAQPSLGMPVPVKLSQQTSDASGSVPIFPNHC